MKKFGFIPSTITPLIPKFGVNKSLSIPNIFSYKNFLSPVTNQGQNPYCIPHSIACWLNWRENMKKGTKNDFHIKYEDIYKSKKSSGEGMTYVEAFKYLKDIGVKTDNGIMKISDFGYVSSVNLLKAAILANGPCFGALPVYDSLSPTFWKKTKSTPEGWHSISIVGWDETGYIIRNSWGTSFANRGYITIPYSDTKSFREIWTILA